ncbi:DUF488 domain-containing protein [Flavobacterium sp.]
MYPIVIKRIYEEAAESDGYRILVDRIWPRGISKQNAHLSEWNKNIAPSTALRTWFDHKEERFQEFTLKYKEELLLQKDEINRIKKLAASKQVTLLYASKNKHLNQAIVLQNILNRTL